MSPNDVRHWDLTQCSSRDYKGLFDPQEFPLGCKFDPSDVELLGHLSKQVNPRDNNPAHKNIGKYIVTLENLCQVHPDELPGMTRDGYARHFYYPPTKTYNVGDKRKLAIGIDSKSSRAGWCKSGKTLVVNDLNKKQIGCKKIFVLHNRKSKKRKGAFGSAKEDEDTKTQWVLHQLQLGKEEEEHSYVVCKVIWQLKPRTMKHGLADDEPDAEPDCQVSLEQGLGPPSEPGGTAVPETNTNGAGAHMSPYEPVSLPPVSLSGMLPSENPAGVLMMGKDGPPGGDPVAIRLGKQGSAFRRLRPFAEAWSFQGLPALGPGPGMEGVGIVPHPVVPIRSAAGNGGLFAKAIQVQTQVVVPNPGLLAAVETCQGMSPFQGSRQAQWGGGWREAVVKQVPDGGSHRPTPGNETSLSPEIAGTQVAAEDCADEAVQGVEDGSQVVEVVASSQGVLALLMCSETPPDCVDNQLLIPGGGSQPKERKAQEKSDTGFHMHSDAQEGVELETGGSQIMAEIFKGDIKAEPQDGGVAFLSIKGGGGGGGGDTEESWREGGAVDGFLERKERGEGRRDSFHPDVFLRSQTDSGHSQNPPADAPGPIETHPPPPQPANELPKASIDEPLPEKVPSGAPVEKPASEEGKRHLPDSEEIQKFMREELDHGNGIELRVGPPHLPAVALDTLDMLAEAGKKAELAGEGDAQERPKQKRSKVFRNRDGTNGERKSRGKAHLASVLTR